MQIRNPELPFLPIFHQQQTDSGKLSWKERVKARLIQLKNSSKHQVALGILVVILLLVSILVLRSDKDELELPSPNFEATQAEWKFLTHLIILPGHAIQWCTEIGKSPSDESCWYLQSFQKGQVKIFLEHIRRALEEAANDPKSLLVMSGGQTRPGVGIRSEAQSYFSVAEKMGFFADFDGTNVYDRTVSEDFAKDSLENVMFSVCRFKQVTGQYPRKITVVGFPFKGARFMELHRKAINFPMENFKYIGVELDGVKQGQIVDDAYADFKNDLYGCGSKLLVKRQGRNPYNQLHGYKESCPDMTQYFDACVTRL